MGGKGSKKSRPKRRLSRIPSPRSEHSSTSKGELPSSSPQLRLSSQQRQVLTQSWRHVPKHNVGPMILQKMMTKAPEIRHVFENMSASQNQPNSLEIHQKHSVVFCELIDRTVKSLAKPDASLAKYYTEVGMQHAHLKGHGFKVSHFEVFGEAMAETVREYVRGRQTTNLLVTWTSVCCHIVERIRQGYIYNAKRRKSALLNAKASSTENVSMWKSQDEPSTSFLSVPDDPF